VLLAHISCHTLNRVRPFDIELTWTYQLVGGRACRYTYVAADQSEICSSEERAIFTGSSFTELSAYKYHARTHRQVPVREPPSLYAPLNPCHKHLHHYSDTPYERLMAFLIKDFGPDLPYVEKLEEEDNVSSQESESAQDSRSAPRLNSCDALLVTPGCFGRG
jgi:hypothetical protein